LNDRDVSGRLAKVTGMQSAVSDGLISLRVRSLVIDPANPQIVYAGTTAGVFRLSPPAPPPLPSLYVLVVLVALAIVILAIAALARKKKAKSK